jgi:hypothetical protein
MLFVSGFVDHLAKSISLRKTEEISSMSGDKKGTPYHFNETMLEYIANLDTNETLAEAIEQSKCFGATLVSVSVQYCNFILIPARLPAH